MLIMLWKTCESVFARPAHHRLRAGLRCCVHVFRHWAAQHCRTLQAAAWRTGSKNMKGRSGLVTRLKVSASVRPNVCAAQPARGQHGLGGCEKQAARQAAARRMICVATRDSHAAPKQCVDAAGRRACARRMALSPGRSRATGMRAWKTSLPDESANVASAAEDRVRLVPKS